MQPRFTSILILADSPTEETGFAQVVQNLLPFWSHKFKRIDIFGICYQGAFHELPYRIMPAHPGGMQWNSKERLEAFLQLLETGNYSHVWIMQDTFQLANGWFPRRLQETCARFQIQSLLYFPVDAPLDPAWTDIILRTQTPVAYTVYGVVQVVDALRRGGLAEEAINKAVKRIRILPHGVNREVFEPLADREAVRAAHIKGLKDDEFLMINVNANQRRKDPARSLEILAELKRRGVPAKLMMHMPRVSADGMDLELIAGQLGLVLGQDWWHGGEYFKGNRRLLPKDKLRIFYGIADLCLSTTKGEGWGFSTTEALAMETPVAIPQHTSCGEITAQLRKLGTETEAACAPIIELPLEASAQVDSLDNSRLRHRVDVKGAADVIEEAWRTGKLSQRRPLNKAARKWLSWMRIANEWLELMEEGCTMKLQPVPEFVPNELGGKDYFMAVWGGLGDAFNRVFTEGVWQWLATLSGNDTVTVAISTHNKFLRELFTLHANADRIKLLEFNYWQTTEYRAKCKQHGLPPPGMITKLPKGEGELIFYPTASDRQVIESLGDLKEAVVIAATAGLPDRSLSAEIVAELAQYLTALGVKVVLVGREYERHGRAEIVLEGGHPNVINLVNQLTVQGTMELVKNCRGVVACHSSVNLLAWHLRKPQLLIHPKAVQKHLTSKDQWGFGADYPETTCVELENWAERKEDRLNLFTASMILHPSPCAKAETAGAKN